MALDPQLVCWHKETGLFHHSWLCLSAIVRAKFFHDKCCLCARPSWPPPAACALLWSLFLWVSQILQWDSWSRGWEPCLYTWSIHSPSCFLLLWSCWERNRAPPVMVMEMVMMSSLLFAFNPLLLTMIIWNDSNNGSLLTGSVFPLIHSRAQ